MDEAALFIRDLAVIMLSATAGGWLARRVGLSPIVGYLIAGIIVGAPEVTFAYVTDEARISVLSQVGLVFLMFSIGLGLRLRRMRELGATVLLATGLTALIVLNLTRAMGAVVGLGSLESLFLAAMMMVSSSAIIGKVLQDGGLAHQRHGQFAMGMTLLEDVVAVVMLTFLGALTMTGGGAEDPGTLFRSVGMLAGFAVMLVVLGVVAIPRLLHRVNLLGAGELETVLVAGLLFSLSMAAVLAGFSLALGAFLTGVIVAETPRLNAIQRNFSGLRDVFATVFFVSIGMTLDLALLPDAIGLIIGGVLLSVCGRVLAAFISLLVLCEDSRTALRTGLTVTPIGEFSFIIAGLGVASGALPDTYNVAAVGMSVVTSLLAPFLIVRSEWLANFLIPKKEGAAGRLLKAYRKMWAGISAQGQRNILWNLSRRRLIQISVEVLFVSAILVFAGPVFDRFPHKMPETVLGFPIVLAYWLGVSLLVMGPLIAIWRNLGALSMIIAEAVTTSQHHFSPLAGAVRITLQAFAAVLMLLWLGSVAPAGEFRGWVAVVVVSVQIVVIIVSWRRINRWHSMVEYELQSAVGPIDSPTSHLSQVSEWGLSVEEITIGDYFAYAGRTIGEIGLRQKTGCSIISIQRQGHRMGMPSPQTHLFPGDEVLLLGEPDQLPTARALLLQAPESPADLSQSNLSTAIMEVARVSAGSSVEGKTLAQLNWPRVYGVQVAGVKRLDTRYITPGATFDLRAGDEVLLLGAPSALRRVEADMAPVSA